MNDNYKKILVAVDGSEQANDAVKEANAIAKKNQADLIVLTIAESSMLATDARVVEYLLEQHDISSNTILSNAEHFISQEVPVSFDKVMGNPKASIVQYAKEHDVDLIVIGATGKGVITRALIGSTAAYVVNHAPCNVLVVK